MKKKQTNKTNAEKSVETIFVAQIVIENFHVFDSQC